MAKRQLVWSLDSEMASVKFLDSGEVVTFPFAEIKDWTPIENEVTFHLFRHGLKQMLADSVAGMKDALDNEKISTLKEKWYAICDGTFSTRTPAVRVDGEEFDKLVEGLDNTSPELAAILAMVRKKVVKK